MKTRLIVMRPDEGTGGADGGAAEIVAGDERPAWLPEKFENPEAFAAAYSESEKELARQRNRADKQEREFTEALQRIEASVQQQPAQQMYNPGADPLLAAAQRAWEEGDMATFMAINAQVSQVATAQLLDERLKPLGETLTASAQADRDTAFRLAEQQVAPLFGDRWGSDLAPKLNDLIGQRPDLLPATPSVEGYAAALTNLAKQVDYDRLVAEQQQLEQARAAKVTAQTLGTSTARVATDTDEKKQAWEEVKNASNQSWQNVVGG